MRRKTLNKAENASVNQQIGPHQWSERQLTLQLNILSSELKCPLFLQPQNDPRRVILGLCVRLQVSCIVSNLLLEKYWCYDGKLPQQSLL